VDLLRLQQRLGSAGQGLPDPAPEAGKVFFSSSYSLSVSLVDVLFVVRVIQLMFRLLALLIAAVKNLAALYLFFLLEQNL
jgi:hypothetical protein